MTNHNLLTVSLALLLLSSVDAFASMGRPKSAIISNSAMLAEVGDMPVADIPVASSDSAAVTVAAAAPEAVAPPPPIEATPPPVAPEVVAPPPPVVEAPKPPPPEATGWFQAPEAATSTDTSAEKIIQSKQFAPPGTVVEKIQRGDDIPLPAYPETNLDTIALVVGQENYGFAAVILLEAIWSFSKAPGIDHGLKTLLPAIVAAGVLGVVSGPMVTSGDAGSVSTGLFIATGTSVAIGLCYAARLSAPFSPSPKEIPALGLLVAFAGFFSFGQNLLVDGFVTLPSIPLPSLPSFDLPSVQLPF